MFTSIRTTMAALVLAGSAAAVVASTAPAADAAQTAQTTIAMPADVGQHQPRTNPGAPPSGPGAHSLDASGYLAYTTAIDSRIRASVPNGRVLGVVHWYNQTGRAGCKIPGADRHLWGWVSFTTTSGRNASGWMRDDLFKIYLPQTMNWGYAVNLPWC